MDSFLDIVANTLGLLILISAMTVVSSRGIKIDLGRPLMKEAEDGLTMVSAECRGGQLYPLEDERMFQTEEDGYSTRYLPIDGAAGIALDAKNGAPLSDWLERFDPDSHWFFVITRPDSFQELRYFRQSVKELGFGSGWVPWPDDREIRFGPSGRSATQD